MTRDRTRSVQRARFRYRTKDIVVVSAAMFGALLLALLAASNGTLVAAVVVGFMLGRTVREVQSAGRRAARALRQAVDDSSVAGVVRQAAGAL